MGKSYTKIIALRDGVVAQGAPDPSYESVSYVFPPDEKIWEMTSQVDTYVHGDGGQVERLIISYLPDKMFDLMMENAVAEDAAVSWMQFLHWLKFEHVFTHFVLCTCDVCLGMLVPTSFSSSFQKQWINAFFIGFKLYD